MIIFVAQGIPLRAREGGVLTRAGSHRGCRGPAADGRAASDRRDRRGGQRRRLHGQAAGTARLRRHGLALITIADLVVHRHRSEVHIDQVGGARSARWACGSAIVVRLVLPGRRPTRPSLVIRRSTVHGATGVPSRYSVSQIFLAP